MRVNKINKKYDLNHIILMSKNHNKNLIKGINSSNQFMNLEQINYIKSKIINNIKTNFPKDEISIISYNQKRGDKNFYEIRNKIYELRKSCKELLFNINKINISLREIIIKLAYEVSGKIYLISDSGEIVFIQNDNDKIDTLIKNDSEEELIYEKLLMNSITFDELRESGNFPYSIKLNSLIDASLSSKEIFNDVILIKKQNQIADKFDLIKLIRINGIRIASDEKITNKHFFLRYLLESLSYFESKVVRIIMNNANTLYFYLGIIISGKNLKKMFKDLKFRFNLLITILKSIFPGIQIISLGKKEYKELSSFIKKQKFYGSIVGHTTVTVTNRILGDLDNAISHENWGFMTIGESLTEKKVDKLFYDLKNEKELLNETNKKQKIDLEYLDIFARMQKRKNSLEQKTISKIDEIIKYVEDNRNYGLWNTCNYFFTDKKNVYNAIYSILKSNYKSGSSCWFSVKIIRLNKLLCQFPKNFQSVSVKRKGINISKEFKLFYTILNSHRLGDYIHLPSKTVSNFVIAHTPTFQTKLPNEMIDKMSNPVKIGTIKNSATVNNDFYIELDSLVRHCLVMGSTGSGKTNTIINMLLKIKETNKNIPFLIIEPIKKEYRHLLNYFNDLEIYSAGSLINPLLINIFEVPPFLNYFQWVNELLELICTSFYIWFPLRDLIMNCLNDIYQINGWTEHKRGRTPTLEEFIKFSKLKINCLDYNLRNKEAFLGAFGNRFESMLKGTRGKMFKTFHTCPNFKDILKKNVIIELDGLRNNDERALVFSYIMKMLYLYQQQSKPSPNLRHITVIEEAHRLISSHLQTNDASSFNISMKAQEEFSDILAEIRTYGEGIIISEQKPQQLNKVAITNTDIKICHKMPSRNQIEDFRDALGLSMAQLPFISKLNPGECILKLENIETPFIIQMDLIKNKTWGIKNGINDEFIRSQIMNSKTLDQIHYKILKDQKLNEFHLIISELIFQYNGRERIIKYPRKNICLNFQNFRHILWNRLKDFYAKYNFCNECSEIIPISKSLIRCQNCSSLLEKIDKLKIPLFNTSIDSDLINRHLKIEGLYDKLNRLIPSEYSNEYRTEIVKIKQEFDNIVNFENK